MNFELSKEDLLFREQVRDWLSANIPRAERPTAGLARLEFDKAWQRTQYDGGWAGVAWPKEYGGRGLSLLEQMIWLEQCAHMGAPDVGVFYVAINHGGPTLIACGTEEQKLFHLPRILRGDSVWCQGFSEPGAGSDLASLRTTGVIDGDHLVVNGSKIWTSFAHYADYQELLVRTDTVAPKHRGITWVICDMKLPGIQVRPIVNLLGEHEFNQVFYDNVRIPLSNVVGGINDGWKVSMTTLGFERGTGLIRDQSRLMHGVDRLIDYARVTPGADGRLLIKDDETAARLATLKAEATALCSMTYMNISRSLRNVGDGSAMTMAALFFAELQQRVDRAAFDLAGPRRLEFKKNVHSLTRDYLHDFQFTIAGGTSEIRRNIIGERVLGLPRG